jgi:hypothetical protein
MANEVEGFRIGLMKRFGERLTSCARIRKSFQDLRSGASGQRPKEPEAGNKTPEPTVSLALVGQQGCVSHNHASDTVGNGTGDQQRDRPSH